MNDYQKAYGELWSVMKYEPACEIEKNCKENIKRLETLESLVERASGIKPAKHAAGHTYCPKCKTVIANKCNVNSLNFCHKCGQSLDWSDDGD